MLDNAVSREKYLGDKYNHYIKKETEIPSLNGNTKTVEEDHLLSLNLRFCPEAEIQATRNSKLLK